MTKRKAPLEPFSVAETCEASFPYFVRRRLVVVLKAYFDESGTHSAARVLAVVGLIHAPSKWQPFERAWRARMRRFQKRYPAAVVFHMTKCRGGYEQFLGIPEKERFGLIDDLADIVCKHRPTIVASVMVKSAWATLADAEFRRRFHTPYHLCLEHCVQQILSLVKERGGKDFVALICSDQSEYEKRTLQVHSEYKKRPEYQNFSLAYFPPAKFMPLQAADLVANETYAYANSKLGASVPTMRDSLKSMIHDGLDARGGYYTEDALAELIARGPSPA